MNPFAHRVARRSLALSAAVLLGACAAPATTTNAEWKDKSFGDRSMRGSVVLVACEAAETALRLRCQEELGARLSARGSSVRYAPQFDGATPGSVAMIDRIAAAKALGATAVLTANVAPAASTVSSGFSLGLGLGGFGRNVGGGVGISAPVGGGQVSTGYAADGKLTEVASGRLVWTASISAPPSGDVNAQMSELARAVVEAAGKAGVL